MRNRRFAGAETALQPVGDVSGYLKSALDTLKGKPDTGTQRFDEQYPSIDETYGVKGTNSRIHLSARPSPMQLDLNATIDGPVLGNRQQMQELAKNPPEVNYTMAWDVDGSYGDYGSGRDRKSKLRIAREAQRRWSDAIKTLPENALVSNSPVGAGQGDYGRADLYMANGFGPVQSDGMQYGIVRKGQIEPLSPFVADSQHVHHLAKRSRMAGDIDVANALLAADASNQSLDPSNFTGSFGQVKGYSGYYDDDYYNDDYIPPMSRGDIEESARRDKELDRTNPIGVPEIRLRDRLAQDIGNQGIDFEIEPGDIQRVRDAQLAALQQEAPMRGVADALQEVLPRPLPQRISVDNYPRDGVVPQVFTADGLSQLPGPERRDAALRLIRDEIDSRVAGTSFTRDNVGIVRDLKSSMVQNIPGAAVELYDSNDVAAIRRLQEAVAIAGGYSPSDIPRSRRRGRRGYGRITSDETGLGKSGNASAPRYGEQLLNIPGASDADLAAIGLRGSNPLMESRSRMLNTIEERFAPSFDGAPRAFHTRYGSSPDEAIRAAGIQSVDPTLTMPQALDILDAASSLRGNVSPQEFAQALLNVRETYPAGAEDALARVFARTGGEMVDGTVRQLDDARLQRPRLPREEMLLRSRLEDDFANAPDDMSIDDFRQWRNRQSRQAQSQQPAPSAGRDELMELMDEGLLQPREATSLSLQLATQRGDTPDLRRNRRMRGVNRERGQNERRYEQLPDEMFFPRSESVFENMDRASLAEQLEALSIRAEELSTPQERVPVQYDISGRPVISNTDIQGYLGGGSLNDVADFRARYGALTPQSNITPFDTRQAAAQARARQQREEEGTAMSRFLRNSRSNYDDDVPIF